MRRLYPNRKKHGGHNGPANAGDGVSLTIVPVTFKEANEYVRRYHRHHKPIINAHIFHLAVANDDGEIVGVALAGRPLARHLCDGFTLEVRRTCTDGTRNANSALYGACWRAAKALGYRRLITYTLKSESGTSLRGAGWKIVAEVKPQSWNRPGCGRPRVDTAATGQEKLRWEVSLPEMA